MPWTVIAILLGNPAASAYHVDARISPARARPLRLRFEQANALEDFPVLPAERSAVDLVEAYLHARKNTPQSLGAVVSELPDLKAYLMTAPIRLAPLLQLFPDRFILEASAPFDDLRARLALDGNVEAASGPVATIPADADAAFAEALSAKILQYHLARGGSPTDPVSVPWLVRTMSAMVEVQVVCAAEPSLLYHRDPSRFGHATRWAAWWACVDAHMRRFVLSHSTQYVWHVGPDGGEQPSAVSLTAQAVQQLARLREHQRAEQTRAKKRRREESRYAPGEIGRQGAASTATGALSVARAAAAPTARVGGALRKIAPPHTAPCEAAGATPLATLLGASADLAHGARQQLIVLRGASRTAALFAEELHAAAEHARVPPEQLTRVGQALFLWAPAAAKAERGGEAEASAAVAPSLLKNLPHLASVRLSGALLLAAPSSDALAASLADRSAHGALRARVFGGTRARGASAQRDRWTLRMEAHFPSAERRMLPFHSLDGAPELAIALHEALGGCFVRSSDAAAAGAVQLAVLQMRGAVVLLRISPLEGTHVHGGVAAATDLADARLADTSLADTSLADAAAAAEHASAARALRLPSWVGRWEGRAFGFSSALDPLVALAALHLGALAHLGRSQSLRGPRREMSDALGSLRIYDPCCGSGTLLAAAASRGCTDLLGSDRRADFIECAHGNLAYLTGRPRPASLHVHDATAPLPPELQRAAPDDWRDTLVISNPPWGKNVGEPGDGAAIVRSITAQCSHATFCWMANARAVRALHEMPQIRLLRCVPFGAVELVVCAAKANGDSTGAGAAIDGNAEDGSPEEGSADGGDDSGGDAPTPSLRPDRPDRPALLDRFDRPDLLDRFDRPDLVDLGLRNHEGPARILILGDADFAYSHALCSALRGRQQRVQLWPTCFEAEAELVGKYPHASSTIAALRAEGHVHALHFGVDGRDVRRSFGDAPSFDRIVFNLPQAPVGPGARNQIQRHRKLLRDLCISAEAALAPDGQLWVTLLAGQGGTSLDRVARPMGDTWQMQHAAASARLLVRAAAHVDAESLGYVPTGRRANQSITPSRLRRGLMVHVLSREGEPAAPAACGALE